MKKTLFKKSMAWLLALMMVITFMPTMAFAEAGQPPAHSKIAHDNGDGTIKLELSVTGESETTDQAVGSANVVLVYDVSQSMTENVQGGNYARADQAEDVVYHFLNDLAGYQNSAKDNIQVALVTFGPTANRVQNWTTNVTGLRDNFDEGPRDNVYNRNGFGYSGNYGTNWEHALMLAQNLVENPPTNAENAPTFVIMITDGAPTANGTNGNNPDNPNVAFNRLVPRYVAALNEALAIATACNNTNGTFYGIYAYGDEADLLDDLMYYTVNKEERATVRSNTDPAENYYNAGSTQALQDAIDEIFSTIVDAIGITNVSLADGTTSAVETSSGEIANLLTVDENSYEYFLTIPLVNNHFTDNHDYDIAVTYSVDSETEIETAHFTWTNDKNEEQTADYTVVEKSDTKVKVKWTEGTSFYSAPPAAKLENSSVHWNLNSLGTLLNGVTYTVTFDVWPGQETLDLIADLKNGVLEYEDTDGDTTNDLDSNIKPLIVRTPSGNDYDYSLKTNTDATMTYTDTRISNEPQEPVGFKNPDPVPTSAVEMLTVSKTWINDIDGAEAEPITLKVLRDGDEHYEVDIDQTTGWKGEVFISTGILSYDEQTKEVIVRDGAEGHDFSFKEPDNLSYLWHLDAQTVHPMTINGAKTPSMLVKVKESELPSGVKEILDSGKTDETATYFKIKNGYYKHDESVVQLNAVNGRKSYLNITKQDVQGNNVPEDALFTFKIKINDSDEEDNWFSIRNNDGGYVLNQTEGGDGTYIEAEGLQAEVKDFYAIDDDGEYVVDEETGEKVIADKHISGLEYDSDTNTYKYTWKYEDGSTRDYTVNAKDKNGKYYSGYYYIPNNKELTVKMQKGWNLRFLNLAVGTTYDIEETEMEEGFKFVKVEGKKVDKADNDKETALVDDNTTDQKMTGNIDATNSAYTISFTNKYELSTVQVVKKFSGITKDQIPESFKATVAYSAPDGYEGTVPDNVELTIPAKEAEPAEGGDDGQVEPAEEETTTEAIVPEVSEDGLTYTWTIKRVPVGLNVKVTEEGTNVKDYVLIEDGADASVKEAESTAPTEGNKTTVLELENNYKVATGTLKITKTIQGLPNNAAPANLKFEVKDAKGKVVASVAYADLKDATKNPIELPVGTYTITESETEYPNYSLNTDTETTKTATVSSDNPAEVAFTNVYTQDTGTLRITKVKNGTPSVPGEATFTVRGPNGNVETFTYSDFSSGSYEIKDLPVGNYSVTETNADVSGYTLTTTYSGQATVRKGQTATITVTNTYTRSGGYIPDEPVPLDLVTDHIAYIEGYPDGTVQPEGNITRSEVATMIYRLLTEDRRMEIFTSEGNYSDVDVANWFNKAVASMTVGEYVNGYPDGSFKPNQAITRAEFVAIVVRFLEGPRLTDNPFSDIDNHWAHDYIIDAVGAGWISGYPDGTFQPDKPITRAEAMTIMNTILHRGVDEESELLEPVMFPDNEEGQWYYFEVIEATNNHEATEERPSEQWTANECEFYYDIEKYERPGV